ncbi:MAG: DNA polymerase IV [Sutterellaceae bacterium]|nr:DNA polymerase IV [Sutterellaceae bacterium]MDY2868277.1 DNA polymerase IV [Mesosutterella sp.]
MDYRKIIHVDMDAFYASVEQRDRPELRGKPIAVGHAEGRGVVATASYEARKFGVHSAMPSFKARELCPSLIFVPPDMERYAAVSQQIRGIFRRFTPLVQPISIDEAFLDVSETQGSGTLAAVGIKRAIREELNLTASAGVSYNKFLAKVASDWKKPDGLFVVPPSAALSFIAELPVEKFWGVGPVTARRMHEAGIATGADLRHRSMTELRALFGVAGEAFWRFARGIDPRPVVTTRETKSVGAEQTLEGNAVEVSEILAFLEPVRASLLRRLARNQFLGNTVTLKLKFADFRQVTRSITLHHPVQSPDEVLRLERELLGEVEIPRIGVRLVGLTVSKSGGDTPDRTRQPELDFGAVEEGKEENKEAAAAEAPGG